MAGDAERPTPGTLDVEDLRSRLGKNLSAFLDARATELATIGDDLELLASGIRDFVLEGGKRLRPAFAYWGWRGAGRADCEEIVAAVSALELLHACALIHDDVMDGSDTRRGGPSVHRLFETAHAAREWRGSAETFGTSAAILLGDMCLVWSDLALATSGLPDADIIRGEPVWHAMRTELMAGQYLDVLAQATGAQEEPVQRALRVARYKSGKYTVERPLHLGAALAGATPELVATYSAYGVPLGEAFQLRDDVLGVFGDPTVTGKPAGDDLREGKRTVLLAYATERSTPAQAALVERLLGRADLDADGVESLREVIVSTGALARVEAMIAERAESSLAALESATIEPVAGDVLRELALAATDRTG